MKNIVNTRRSRALRLHYDSIARRCPWQTDTSPFFKKFPKESLVADSRGVDRNASKVMIVEPESFTAASSSNAEAEETEKVAPQVRAPPYQHEDYRYMATITISFIDLAN